MGGKLGGIGKEEKESKCPVLYIVRRKKRGRRTRTRRSGSNKEDVEEEEG